ncbi:hypothetical protein [Azonexus sp. IMCC34839]|uniref:hypothetical protein n=1 Tax=Azonexus sp. IMCC34839 TaxID=3133695 RepID=UPI00399A9E57
MSGRIRINPAKANSDGFLDAMWMIGGILASIRNSNDGERPNDREFTKHVTEALGEIVWLASENRLEEAAYRLEGFAEVVTPLLVAALRDRYKTPFH